MERFLANRVEARVRLIFSLHPTCRTTDAVLQNAVRLTEKYGDCVAFKVYPEASLDHRSSNLLCCCDEDGSLTISTGPTENLGYAPMTPSHANLATRIHPSAFEACRKWFDYLWAIAGPLRPDIAASMPRLCLPSGDMEAASQWEAFRRQCLDQDKPNAPAVVVHVDPVSGEVVLQDEQGEPVISPTEEMGVPTLDLFCEGIARVFDLGALVAIDKGSRLPPLEAPVKPEWFGVDSFRQTGMVRSQTSIKVAPFDEALLKKIDKLRTISGDLLPRFSFALADGVRWIPRAAISLFEAALSDANDDAKKLLGTAVGDDVGAFLVSQRDRVQADAQRMYEAYHPGGKIPEAAVIKILDELSSRLAKTKADKLIPQVAYSPVAFNPSQSSTWSSPWGQAFTLLKGIAEFPRKAMTDRFFWRGIKTKEDILIRAMNVAGDYLVEEYGGRKAAIRAEFELDLIKQLDDVSAEAEAKCRALWELMTTGQESALIDLITSKVK